MFMSVDEIIVRTIDKLLWIMMNINSIICDSYNNMIHYQIHVLGLLILEKIDWDHVWGLGMKVNDEHM